MTQTCQTEPCQTEPRQRRAVSRRTLLVCTVTGAAGAAALFASARQAQAKMAQTAAGYQDSPKGDQQCSTCSLFQAPNGCQLVDGNISPSGWCKFFVKKSG